MNKTLKTTLALVAAGALSLSACQGGGSAGTNNGGGASKGPINIGIKYDQPGLGLKEGNAYTGFDVEVAKYVAKELGHAESDIKFIETPSAQRESMIQGDQVKLIFATYSITDARKEKISFAGPYLQAGQALLVKNDSTIAGPEDLKGKKLCSVAGSTPAKKIHDTYPEVALSEQDTYSKCVQALSSGTVDAVTTDDIILAGFAAQAQYKGKLKVVGKPFTKELYGVGMKKGDLELCKSVNTALEKMVSSGEWQKAIDKTVGQAGYKPDAATNPPKPAACS